MYRCSECGRTISSKMRGVCMACRYAEIRRRAAPEKKRGRQGLELMRQSFPNRRGMPCITGPFAKGGAGYDRTQRL